MNSNSFGGYYVFRPDSNRKPKDSLQDNESDLRRLMEVLAKPAKPITPAKHTAHWTLNGKPIYPQAPVTKDGGGTVDAKKESAPYPKGSMAEYLFNLHHELGAYSG